MNSLYILPILLFSIVVHEVAHGWMALLLGDPTARDSGRLTLNPIPHIDPIGSIAIPLLSYITAGSVFIAWAKPVPVNPANFRKFRRDDILVSLVGPFSNLLVAFCCAACYVISDRVFGPLELIESNLQREIAAFFIHMFAAGITLNIFLAVFNLIPVPPLDGSHVLSSLLPAEIGERFRQIGFFGILLVIMLMRLDPFRNFILTVVMTVRIPYEIFIKQFLFTA
ncbi:MAG: site-2 protease family protein [Ignavibacteriae bacterium]|nr:MAG: site-2 protease family protein [Ignavibacteriota bacterium]